MANAILYTHKVPAQVTKTVWQTLPEDIVLTLTPKEAVALSRTLNFVGGSPEETARGYVGDIQEALTAAGVPGGVPLLHEIEVETQKSAIYFQKGSREAVDEVVSKWGRRVAKGHE